MSNKKYAHVTNVEADIIKVKEVARKLLSKLEIIVDMESSTASDEQVQKYHDRLFGNKTSLVNNLVTIAELFNTLDKIEKYALTSGKGYLTLSQPNMSESDVALVEMFLTKMKHLPTLPAPRS